MKENVFNSERLPRQRCWIQK